MIHTDPGIDPQMNIIWCSGIKELVVELEQECQEEVAGA